MELFNRIIVAYQLAGQVIEQFKQSDLTTEATPHVFLPNGKDFKQVSINNFEEESIQQAIMECNDCECFALTGETKVKNKKTESNQRFFILKLFIKGLENSYIYSIQIFEETGGFGKLRMLGCESNPYLRFTNIEGEESNVNAIKMEATEQFQQRMAVLIGHMNQERLYFDTAVVIADLYCKLFLNEASYELIFEISKYGLMTDDVQEWFDNLNEYFNKIYEPSFHNISSKLQLANIENTSQ